MHPSKLLVALLLGGIALSTLFVSTPASAQALRIDRGGVGEIKLPPPPPPDPEGSVRRYFRSLRSQLIGRIVRLPTCGVSGYEDSLYFPVYEERAWKCVVNDEGASRGCRWSSGARPDEDEYWVLPAEPYYNQNLVWPDGDALYGTWNVLCRHDAASSTHDTVVKTATSGKIVTPLPWGDERFLDLEYVHLHGGFVEHIRPAFVSASVVVRRNEVWATSYDDDMVLAIQVYGDDGWQDVETRAITTTWSYRTYRVEAWVPELSDVRLEVRGKHDRYNHIGSALSFRDAQMFVEHCFPDLSNPGECFE